MSGDWAGRRALVTGASRGIGRAIAQAFAGEGAHVAIAYGASPAKAEETVASITAAGGQAFPVHLDVSDEASIASGFAESLEGLGGLDILVSNAGVMLEKPLLETTAADYDRVMGVNLRGVFLVGREGLRILREQWRRAFEIGASHRRRGRRPLSWRALAALVRAARA